MPIWLEHKMRLFDIKGGLNSWSCSKVSPFPVFFPLALDSSEVKHLCSRLMHLRLEAMSQGVLCQLTWSPAQFQGPGFQVGPIISWFQAPISPFLGPIIIPDESRSSHVKPYEDHINKWLWFHMSSCYVWKPWIRETIWFHIIHEQEHGLLEDFTFSVISSVWGFPRCIQRGSREQVPSVEDQHEGYL